MVVETRFGDETNPTNRANVWIGIRVFHLENKFKYVLFRNNVSHLIMQTSVICSLHHLAANLTDKSFFCLVRVCRGEVCLQSFLAGEFLLTHVAGVRYPRLARTLRLVLQHVHLQCLFVAEGLVAVSALVAHSLWVLCPDMTWK